jgi:hypothetical protein
MFAIACAHDDADDLGWLRSDAASGAPILCYDQFDQQSA